MCPRGCRRPGRLNRWRRSDKKKPTGLPESRAPITVTEEKREPTSRLRRSPPRAKCPRSRRCATTTARICRRNSDLIPTGKADQLPELIAEAGRRVAHGEGATAARGSCCDRTSRGSNGRTSGNSTSAGSSKSILSRCISTSVYPRRQCCASCARRRAARSLRRPAATVRAGGAVLQASRRLGEPTDSRRLAPGDDQPWRAGKTSPARCR